MKKKFLFILGIIVCLSGCGTKVEEETLAMKCQKVNDYEFYNSTKVIGVYNTEKGDVTKIEVFENYTPKWEDVDSKQLISDLENLKKGLEKKYENVTFKTDKIGKDITSDYFIPVTSKNMKKLKIEEEYKASIKDDLFSIVDYWSYLENQGYVCE